MSNTLIFLKRNAKNRHTPAQMNRNGTMVESSKPATWNVPGKKKPSRNSRTANVL